MAQKTYTFTVTEDENSELIFGGTNDGFSHLELIGILEMAKADVVEHLEMQKEQ